MVWFCLSPVFLTFLSQSDFLSAPSKMLMVWLCLSTIFHIFFSNCFLSTIPNSMKKAGHRIDPVQPFSYALLPPVIRIQIHIHLFAVLQQTLCKIHVESMRDCHIPLRINHNLKHHSVTGTMDNAQNISPHDLCIHFTDLFLGYFCINRHSHNRPFSKIYK